MKVYYSNDDVHELNELDGDSTKKTSFFNSKYFKTGLTGFLTVAACLLFYYLIFQAHNIKAFLTYITRILTPIYLGIIIAYLLSPILNTFEAKLLNPIGDKLKFKDQNKRKKLTRAISVLMTLLLVLLVFFLIINMLIKQIAPSISEIAKNMDSYLDNFTVWVNKTLTNNPELRITVNSFIGKSSNELDEFMLSDLWKRFSQLLTVDNASNIQGVVGSVYSSVKSILGGVWNLIIGLIISIYLLAGKEQFVGRMKKIVYSILNRKRANTFIEAMRFTNKTFIGFVGGKIIDSIIIGIICFLGTSFLHTPYAALVSVIVGVTNIIPFFGPLIGAVPRALLIFVVDPMHPLNLVYFVIFVAVLQQLDGNVIGPMILGESTGLEGFWVIFAITLFGGFWGVPGMIVGVPLFAVIYALLKHLVANSLSKKGNPTDTESYILLKSINEDGSYSLIDASKTQKEAKEPNAISKLISRCIDKRKNKNKNE